jgi:hypothetical protein
MRGVGRPLGGIAAWGALWLSGACAPADAVLSGVLREQTAPLVAVVDRSAPGVVELYGIDDRPWLTPRAGLEVWIYDTAESVALEPGRYKTGAARPGMLTLPTPRRHLVGDDDSEWQSSTVAPEAVHVRVEGCPLVEVREQRLQEGDFPRVTLISNYSLSEYGDDAIFSFTSGRTGTRRIRLEGAIERAQEYFIVGGHTLRDRSRYVFGTYAGVYAASTTTAIALARARWISGGFRGLGFAALEGGDAWVFLTDAGRQFGVGERTQGSRGPAIDVATGSLAVLEPGLAAGVRASTVVRFDADGIVSTSSPDLGALSSLLHAPGIGLVVGSVAGRVAIERGDKWQTLPALDGERLPIYTMITQPRGFAVLYGSGRFVHVDDEGRACPALDLARQSTDGNNGVLGLAAAIGPCGGPDCRWRTTVLTLLPDRLVFVTPVE